MRMLAILAATLAVASSAQAEPFTFCAPQGTQILGFIVEAPSAPTPPKTGGTKKTVRKTTTASSVCTPLALAVNVCKATPGADCTTLGTQLAACQADEKTCVETCAKCAQALATKWGPTATGTPGASATSSSATVEAPSTASPASTGLPGSSTSGAAAPVTGAVH